MKSNLSKLILMMALSIGSTVNSQIGSPTPYCALQFANNYNMVKSVNVMGTSFNMGAAGSWMATNNYTFYNNAVFPNLAINASSTISIGFYSAQDGEPRYFALWIDYDNNSTFDPAELIMQNSNTTFTDLPTFAQPTITVSKTFTVPAGTTPGTKRMRLVRTENPTGLYSPYTATFVPSPCGPTGGNSYGCCYDFTVNVAAGATLMAPAPQFMANITSTVVNSVISFSDQSTNTPTAWKWTISPATFSYTNGTTDISQHPKVKFTAIGTYTVKLKVSNAGGPDSLTKTSYIKITTNNLVGINEAIGEDHNINVFPNPTNGEIFIDANNDGIIRAEILDNLGKQISVFEGTSTNISELPGGIYFIKISTKDSNLIYKKIVKE